jgi:glutathione S-transferase
LLAVNPAARVPAVVTPEGRHLTESLLVLMRLEHTNPEPSLLGADVDRVLELAGIAYGVIEAAVHTVVGRLISEGSISATGFDEKPVGLRRRRTMLNGLALLNSAPPIYAGGTPDLAVIATVVALDYVKFRFGDTAWLTPFPALQALSQSVAERPSFAATRPFA